MKKNEVKIGGTYLAKVSDRVVPVRLDRENQRGGWDATNLMTDKKVRIKSAQRLRCPANRAGSAQEDPEVEEPAIQDDVEDTTNAIPETPDAIETPDTTEDDVAPASDVESVAETPQDMTPEPEPQAATEMADTAEVATPPVPDTQHVAKTPGRAEDATAPIPEPQNVAETPATTDDAATPAPEVLPAAETPATTEDTAPEVPATTEAPAETKIRKAKAEPKPKKTSCLDAAARVLVENGKPMNCLEMVEEMSRKGYWSSPNGATPQATLYSAILREIKVKGDEARFVKAERGKFKAK